jgi:hypothetical protein
MSLLRKRHAKTVATLLAVPALLLAFTACAAGPGSGSGSGQGGGGASESAQSARDTWQLKFAQCMRDNGVDMPDPSGGSGTAAFSVDDSNQDAMMAASDTCQKKVGTPPPFSPEEKKEMEANMQKAMLKTAKCYRDSGFDVPDPRPGEGVTPPAGAPDDVVEKCGGGMSATAPIQ